MQKIWANGRTGVYVDEGYMIPNKERWFRALLTQGRSKHIPMIVLSQRPVDMDLYVFSEADFIQSFDLNYDKDCQRVEQYMKRRNAPALDFDALKRYQSFYYDVAEKQLVILNPVANREAILSTIHAKLARIPRDA